MDECKVILLHESVRESWARDMGTLITVLSCWSLGWFAESPALMWVGVLFALLLLLLRGVARFKGAYDQRMTPAQAREWLDREFPD